MISGLDRIEDYTEAARKTQDYERGYASGAKIGPGGAVFVGSHETACGFLAALDSRRRAAESELALISATIASKSPGEYPGIYKFTAPTGSQA